MTKSPYLTVGGPKQRSIPGPVLGVIFEHLVQNPQVAGDLQDLASAALKEHSVRLTQEKKEAHALRVMNARTGARFVLSSDRGLSGLRDLKGKVLRLDDTYWVGRGARRTLKVRLQYARNKYLEVEPQDLTFMEDVIAKRMGV